ncbi:MAG TPA: glycerol-3-phosphate 1-O-acyltransferase PlsY [Candidatus Binatia bacterium]|nr:glycerol-3-phosphate 1-O-acyltransferase PlsY [Candidatus Binatia bacterium]
MEVYLLVLFSYLLGSVPTGYILGSLAGFDVRRAGSGNVGATNVARVVGKRHGVFTLAADVAKGFVPVVIALNLDLTPLATASVGIAAFLGHLYPVFLRFQGGKGVATALGVFLALAPWATLILAVIFFVALLTSRVVSLSSMVSAASAPIVFWLYFHSPVFTGTSLFIAVMIVLRHRSNIQRLRSGTEPRLGAASSR